MRQEQAFELVRQANPVATGWSGPGGFLSETALLERIDERSGDMQTQERPEVEMTPAGNSRRRRLIATAIAAVIAVVAIGTVALIVNRGDGDQVAASPDAARINAAIATTERFLGAINSGDVDTLVAMTNPTAANLVQDRNMWEMNAVLTTSGYEYVVGECRAGDVTGAFVDVSCNVTITDPVFEAEGVSTLIFPLRVFDDDTTRWQPFEGGDVSVVNQDYADYLRAFHAAGYEAVCSPAAYEGGTIVADRGLALTGACAELYVPLAPDVAQWVKDGKPLP